MGKNKNKGKGNKRKAAVQEVSEKDLDRFAGSSGEEDNELEQEEHDENDIPVVADEPDDAVDEFEDEVEEADSEEEVASEDEDEVEEEATGMANAMARILGTQTTQASAVLSKTVTPLQRMARKEKVLLKEAREKRKANRELNLTALHIPLSVATTRSLTSGSSSNLVKELEMERGHRRVATRGVVALFNAISQHQKDARVSAVESASKANSDVKHMTKHGFLDMIKSSAKDAKQDGSEKAAIADSSKPKWKALKDDYMLNSTKMKDWDKESSDDDDGEEPQEVLDDNWSDEEVEKPAVGSGKKRRKVTSQ